MPQGIEPSNLDKVYWPEDGLTKGDLLAYYEAVAPFLVPALRGRPLTVKRFPDGIHGPFFFQKNTPSYAPDWVATVELRAWSAKRDVRYTLCDSKRILLWLGNQASIELHPFLSRTDRLDRPTHLIFDVDPPEGGFDRAVEVALAVGEALERNGLRSAVKTSGAKGIHVYVPLERRYDYGRVRDEAVRIGEEVRGLAPDLVTLEFRKADRGGRVLLDVNRNGLGAHTVSAYSPRARPGAAVSFPVRWDELTAIHPGDFTIRSAPEILEREGDRWKTLMPPPQRLPRG